MSKRSGQITADITPARISEALDAGHKVYVEGHDVYYDLTMRGFVQEAAILSRGMEVYFKDETPGGVFEGKRVALLVDNLNTVTIDG